MRGKLLRVVLWALLVALGVGACPANAAGQTVASPTVTRTDTSGSGRAAITWPATWDSSRVKVTICAQIRAAGANKAEVCRTRTGPWVRRPVAPPPPPPPPAPVPPPAPPPPPPPANAAPVSRPTVSCTGNSCSFDGRGSSDDQGVVSWTWWDGSPTNPLSTAATFRHPPLSGTTAAPRTRVWKLTVRDGAGLSHTDSVRFTVPAPNPPPPPTDSTPPLAAIGVTLGALAISPDSARITLGWASPADAADSTLVQLVVPDPPGVLSQRVGAGMLGLSLWRAFPDRSARYDVAAQVCRCRDVCLCTGAPSQVRVP